MTTKYPKDRDVFGEPSAPDQTPLNSAGTSTRNHVEHHRDLGDAVEALQQNAVTYVHNHSGGVDEHGNTSPKLTQINTHEDPDTDTSSKSLHHTLGRGEFQAAPGNHKHDFNSSDIINKPFQICSSTSRPTNPILGMQIFETDTNCMRVWSQFVGDGSQGLYWALIPGANVPIIRLTQTTGQRILSSGSPLEWNVIEEDPFHCFNPETNKTEIVIPENGLYDIECSIAWNPDDLFGDHAFAEIVVDGVPTRYIESRFVRGNLFNPGFSQTVPVSGKMRLKKGQRLSVRARHNGAFSQFTYSSSSKKIFSRLDVVYMCP